MTRESLLEEINELLEEEHGNAISEEQALVESEIDSFGLTMVLVAIDQKYKVYPKEVFKDLPFDTITAKDVINDILAKHDSN